MLCLQNYSACCLIMASICSTVKSTCVCMQESTADSSGKLHAQQAQGTEQQQRDHLQWAASE